jgi:trehalose/maltose hydrolase-like predicted phosphorylase
MSKPINPRPVLGSGNPDLPAYLSNGLIGLRVRNMPLMAGWALLSGYTGEHYERKIEASAVTPYPIAADLAINDIWLSDAPERVTNLEQSYDFSVGELRTRFSFTAAARAARVDVLTFCSRAAPSLICQEINVEVDGGCGLRLRAGIDAGEAAGRPLKQSRSIPGEEGADIDGSLLWESAGALSTCGVAYVTELVGGEKQSPARPPLCAGQFASEYQLRAQADRCIRLRQIASIVPNVMHHMPDQQATRLVAKARNDGFEKLRSDNSAVWEELWKGRIRLEGASEHWQALTDAAFYYLNSSVHASSPASTSIFGLATWRNYH